MLVIKKESYTFKNNKDTREASLRGIKCRWFTKEGIL
jgi:hypothetical protein